MNIYNFGVLRFENYDIKLQHKFLKIILGNAKLNILTSQANYELLIRMKTFENENGYARYSDFKVDDDASKFKMTLSKSSFTGNVGEQYLYKFSLS